MQVVIIKVECLNRFRMIRRCKGTTKNAHMQEKWGIFAKKDRLIYLIRCLASTQARLKVDAKCRMMRCKPIFCKYYERTCIWAALGGSSYGGIGFVRGWMCGKPRQMSEGQWKQLFFWNKNTPSLMATKIFKNLENSFVFAPNEIQQAALEGAKQNEILRTTMRIN